ncbi:ribosomal protection-like ABC-F family protein [Micromonospora sp. NPDC003197]
MAIQLALHDVTMSYGERLVLDRISLTVPPGEHVGIVGENGSGKSTLLRLIVGVETPDDGQITVTADGGVGHLAQTLDLPGEHTVGQAIDAALAELRAVERRLRELESDLTTAERLSAYGELLSAYEARGGYEADARVDKALHGLGLAHIGRDRRLGSLSGGEQARLALACLLAADPEVLLLDEPTNHLDGTALTWLEERLRAHRGTVVVVSHDRVLLDRVAAAIVEVADGTVSRFGNGYDGYLTEKAAARARWQQAYLDWQAEIRRLTEYAATTAHRAAPGRPMKDNNKLAYDRDRGRVQSSISSRVRNAQERLRRLTAEPVPVPPEPLRFAGRLAGGDTTGPLIELAAVRVADRLAVDALSVAAGERLLVHGPNGAGKSTLLRVLAGELAPDHGTVRRHGRIGYLPQESPVHRPRQSVLAAYAEGRPGDVEEHRDRLLALGLFHADTLRVPVGALSVGQRRRLALARLLVGETDLLLLDEPTNHLSLTLVEELEQALADYPGALVVVSHDRAFRRRFVGQPWELRDGRPAGQDTIA